MKKTTYLPKTHKKSPPKKAAKSTKSAKPAVPAEDTIPYDPSAEEPELATDQFAVVGREEEASSSGHRVEPIEEDDEHNAEKLVEEGLHGYLRASPNHTHRGK